LFNIAIHSPIIKRLNKILNPTNGPSYGCVIALHDDINFLVQPEAFSKLDLWNEFNLGLLECGLETNMTKSKFYLPLTMPNYENALSLIPQGIGINNDGVKLAGSPIGTPEFCFNFWESTLIQEISHAIPLVCTWPNVQAALCLLRLCICTKFNHCLRLTDPTAEYSSKLIDRLHYLVQLGLSYVIDYNTSPDAIIEISDNVWDQSTLPPKKGGLGIPDPKKMHIPAYLATCVASSMSMLRLKEAMRSINDKSDQCIDSQRTEVSLNELLICNLRENTTVQELFSKFKNTYNIQKDSSELIFKKIAMDDKPQAFLYSFVIVDIDSRIRSVWSSEDVTRLDSCCYEGGILITSLPIKKEFSIPSPHLFRERIRMRLGLSIKGCNAGPCLDCNGHVDENGYHLLSVCKIGNERQCTHNAVRDAVVELCRYAGLVTRIEDPNLNKLANIKSKRRTDFVCDNFLPGVPLTFDVAVTDPRQFALIKPQPGKASITKEKSKINKYEKELSKFGALFQPFVLESFGRWGPLSRLIFKELISRAMATSATHSLSLSRPVVAHYWRTKITLAMHRQANLGMYQRIQRRLKSEMNKSNNNSEDIIFQQHKQMAENTTSSQADLSIDGNTTSRSSFLKRTISKTPTDQAENTASSRVLLSSNSQALSTSPSVQISSPTRCKNSVSRHKLI